MHFQPGPGRKNRLDQVTLVSEGKENMSALSTSFSFVSLKYFGEGESSNSWHSTFMGYVHMAAQSKNQRHLKVR